MREIHDEDVCNKKPLEKCVTDITELKAKDGKLYVSAIFDCVDLSVLGLVMDDNMGAELCVRMMDSAVASYPALRGSHRPLWPGFPVHQWGLSGRGGKARHPPEHEQRRRPLS